MNVLIYEPSGGTHFFQHVALIAQASAELGCNVSVSLSSIAETLPGYQEFIAPLRSVKNVEVFHSNPFILSVPVLRTPSYRLRWLNEAIERHRPDHVFVTYGDGIMHEVGLRRLTLRRGIHPPTDAEVLLFKGRIAYPFAGAPLKEQLSVRSRWALVNSGRWARKFHIDPFVCEMQRARGIDDARRFHVMPEPLEPVSTLDKTQARRFLNLDEKSRWLVLPGGIDERKGVDLLLRGFAAAKLDPTFRLLLMGKADPAMIKLIDSEFSSLVQTGQVVVRNGFVTDEQLLASVRAADVIAAPHRSCFQSSGIFMRGVVAERPIVGTELGWIGKMVRLFSLGWVCNTFDPALFGQTIRKAFENSDAFVAGEATRRLAEFHTIRNFQETWTDGIRQKLGIASQSSRRTWNWVMESARRETEA